MQGALPNHFMKQYVFSPFVKNQKYTTDELEILKSMKDNSPKDMKKYIDADKKLQEDVRKHYLKVTKEKIEKIIFDTIMNEKTPIAVNLGNSHYITITGYNKTTGILDIVDSQQKPEKPRLRKILMSLSHNILHP